MIGKLKIYQIDAFTNKIFGGNPAAVCILESWLEKDLMQKIALENNLSETAFLVKQNETYHIKWFTPTVEIALCGHATLAAAFVLFHYYNYSEPKINFFSDLSGSLSAEKKGEEITLNFPIDEGGKVEAPANLLKALEVNSSEIYKGKTDYLVLLDSKNEVLNCNPNFDLLKKVKARGIIITAKGETVDFVSRFFAPASGINEDPVTGSAHTLLTPFWSKRLNKTKLTAKQLSKRVGDLKCELKDNRVNISGNAICYLIGEIKF